MKGESRPSMGAAPDPAEDHVHRNDTAHPLREAIQSLGGPMRDWTIQQEDRDPFRQDTPGNNTLGAWLRDHIDRLGIPLPIHIRGIHYSLLAQPVYKPDGTQYENTDKNSTWLEGVCSAARWLDYVPFDQIIDQRSEKPVIRSWQPPNPRPHVWMDFEVYVPDADDLTPTVDADDFTGSQQHHLAIFGEKSSLQPVLGPIAERYGADLYLATGDLSNTMVYTLAKTAAADGRPLEVFYFADCDPSGYHMSIVLAHKMNAFSILQFPDLDFRLRRVALTPAQVKEHDLLPSPLKPGDPRREAWMEAFRVGQTEIDSIATLRPDLLRRIAVEAISPFYDNSLDRRVREAQADWRVEAQDALDAHIGSGNLDQMREETAGQLAGLQDEMQQLISSLRVDVDGFEFPPMQIPEAELRDPPMGEVLCDSRWPLRDRFERLIESKKYEAEGD